MTATHMAELRLLASQVTEYTGLECTVAHTHNRFGMPQAGWYTITVGHTQQVMHFHDAQWYLNGVYTAASQMPRRFKIGRDDADMEAK